MKKFIIKYKNPNNNSQFYTWNTGNKTKTKYATYKYKKVLEELFPELKFKVTKIEI